MQTNVCLVFNDFCGAVDCFNEASCENGLPTILLDCTTKSESPLLTSITNYIAQLPFKSTLVKCLSSVSNRFDAQHNTFRSYIQSMSHEELINLFFSILRQYPVKEIATEGMDTTSCRSAVILIKTTLHSFQSLEYQILDIIANEFPQILFVVSVDDVITDSTSHPLLVFGFINE